MQISRVLATDAVLGKSDGRRPRSQLLGTPQACVSGHGPLHPALPTIPAPSAPPRRPPAAEAALLEALIATMIGTETNESGSVIDVFV